MNSPPRPRSAAVLDAFTRVLRRRRRPLAALAAFFAVFWGISAARAPAPPTVTVVAAARDLPGGTVLGTGDLAPLALPADAVPQGAATDPGAVVGRVINGPLAARSVLTEAAVSSGADLAGPGQVVLAVPLANQSLGTLLEAGARVDLISAGAGAVLVANARVVRLPQAKEGAWASSAAQPALLVEVPAETAPRLAQAVADGPVTVVLR